MSTPQDDVDRAAVERRARWQPCLLPPVLAGMTAASLVLMSGSSPVLLGPVGWSIVVVVAVAAAVAVRVGERRPDQQRRAAEARRVDHAVTARVDPGPGLRERTDRQAQHLSAAGHRPGGKGARRWLADPPDPPRETPAPLP